MNSINLAATALTLAFTFGSAFAQRSAPNDNELRTAYCIPVMHQAVQDHEELTQLFPPGDLREITARETEELKDKLKRMQSYLLPKASHLDLPSLTIAAERGKLDRSNASQAKSLCFRQCQSSKPKGIDDEFVNCLKTCHKASSVIARTLACEAADWLPF